LAAGAAMSDDEAKTKAKSAIEEFVAVADLDEAVRCIQEIVSPARTAMLLEHLINLALERKDADREVKNNRLASFISCLTSSTIISSPHHQACNMTFGVPSFPKLAGSRDGGVRLS
jgi:hypothetical protein